MSPEHPEHIDHVWVVHRTEEVDGIYVFVDEDQAHEFADRYDDSVVSEEVLMNRSAGAQFLIHTAADDEEDEPYDHSRAKEDRRNAFLAEESDAPPRRLGDAPALDAIAEILRDPEWGVGMLEDIAVIVRDSGRDLSGTGEPTWDRH